MELVSFLQKAIPDVKGNCLVYNLSGSSEALLLALERKPFAAIEQDEGKAATLAKDINFFRSLFNSEPVSFLPDPNGPEASGARSKIIYSIKDSKSIVTSSRNLSTSLRSFTDTVLIKNGETISRSYLEEYLALLGYKKVPMVVEKGEYSPRGWVMDIFPSTSSDPLRLEFFGDEIENLRTFDIETQRSRNEISEFLLFPSAEPE